jgi:hypothetical protein
MTTYGVAVLALLVAITVAVSRDAILVMLKPNIFKPSASYPSLRSRWRSKASTC